MGLGDHISLNGLVHTLLDDVPYEKIHLFCRESYRKMLLDLYPDPNVVLVGIPSGLPTVDHEIQHVNAYARTKPNIPLMRLGFYQYIPKPDVTCDRAFYDMANVPYENRFARFKMNRNPIEEERVYRKLNPHGDDYIFIHDDPSRGFTISVDTPYRVVKNDPSESVFHYGLVIERAKEFHCIESCFRCLTNSL